MEVRLRPSVKAIFTHPLPNLYQTLMTSLSVRTIFCLEVLDHQGILVGLTTNVNQEVEKFLLVEPLANDKLETI